MIKASICFILLAALLAETKAAPNPAYVAWSGFKPGSSVTTSTITTQAGAKLSDVENTLVLQEVQPEKLILESSGSMEAGDSRLKLPADKQTVPATVASPPDAGPVVDEADETIEVANKPLKTRRVRRVTQTAGIRTETTTWSTPQIPGGIALQKINVIGKERTETIVEIVRYEAIR